MRYLKIFGLTDEQIDRIVKYNDDKTVNDLIIKENEVSKVLDYLIDIGIKDIYPFLTYRVDFVYENIQDIVESFHKFGTSKAAELLNSSVDYLDLIYFNN